MHEIVMKHLVDPRNSRILMDIMRGGRVTVKGLCESNPDVPRSTMYRILTRMERDGLVDVVEYRQKRGAVEKTYALRESVFQVSPEDQPKSYSQLTDLFVIYCMNYASQFRAYAEENPGPIDVPDMMGFWTAPIYATDSEMMHLMDEYGRLISEYSGKGAGDGRKLHSVGFIVSPPAPEDIS